VNRLNKLIVLIGLATGPVFSAMSQGVETAKDKTPIQSGKPVVLVTKEKTQDFLHKYVLDPSGKKDMSGVKITQNSSTTVTGTTKTTVITLTKTPVKQELQPAKKESSVAEDMMGWLKEKYSLMMDVMPEQIKNVMLYRFIDEWYGVRYRMGGTTKKGIDCSAFVQQLYKYAFGTDLLRTACMQFNSASYVKNRMDLKEGDLVFFRIGTSRISHVGVYLNNNYFVHSASSKGVSIASLTNSYWAKYFVGGGRILESAN
jgi:hypothetical protein